MLAFTKPIRSDCLTFLHLVHQDDGWSGLPKKYLMKELKCKSIKDLQKEMESYELNYSELRDYQK